MSALVAVDIGGTKVRISSFPVDADWSAAPTAERVFETPRSGNVVAALAERVREVVYEGDEDACPIAVGVGCPGPLDPLRGIVLNPPNLSREWWGLGLTGALAGELGISPDRVALENDCNLAALGEATFGAGRPYGSTLYITVSTGVGGGLVLEGEIFGGERGYAVEIGHTKLTDRPYPCGCGRTGCVESAVSGTAIARRAREAGWTPPSGGEPTAKAVLEAATSGDAVARDIVETAAAFFAETLVDAVYLYDPAVIVVGGGVSESDLFMDLSLAALERVPTMPAFRGVPVLRAALEPRSVVAGAFVLAGRLGAG